MPPASTQKTAYNKQLYQKTKPPKQLIDNIKSILAGRKTQAETLEKYGLTMDKVNRIRALNPNFRIALEETHGVKLEKLYRGKTTLPSLNTTTVQVRVAPAPELVPKYDQGLKDNPQKGTDTPITWRQIHTFWAGDLDRRHPGSNRVMKVTRDGVLVPFKYKLFTK